MLEKLIVLVDARVKDEEEVVVVVFEHVGILLMDD